MLTEAPPMNYTISVERVLPTDVTDKHDMLAGILMKSCMYDAAGVEKVLLDCTMPGGLQMWLLRGTMEDGRVFPAGAMTTIVGSEEYTGKKWLLLMHVNDVVHIELEQWKIAYEALFDYAKERKCQWVEVFTFNPRAYELLAALGFRICGFRKEV